MFVYKELPIHLTSTYNTKLALKEQTGSLIGFHDIKLEARFRQSLIDEIYSSVKKKNPSRKSN